MKIAELLREIEAKFPKFPMAAWADTYRQVLGPHEGERLAKAWHGTLSSWNEFGAPKPAHIAANLPLAKQESYFEKLARLDEERLGRQRKRADQLYATALRECADQLEGSWADYAKMHLRAVTHRIAFLEERGHTLAAALATINGSELRSACAECRRSRPWGKDEAHLCPPRPADAWLDEHDAWIFKARQESQARVNPKGAALKRGDREPPWRLKAERRDEINARIPKS
jgi:hypothetical protein